MSHIFGWTRTVELNPSPSPLGRGCPAAGAFTSRSGTGEGSVGARRNPLSEP